MKLPLQSILSSVLFVIIAFLPISAVSQTSCSTLPPVSQQRNAQFGFSATAIKPHPDDKLTRVCGKLTGMPHTSNRIDRVMLINGNDTVIANDIDGVDFNRYFQWEDEAVIDLEIDFPAPAGHTLPTVNDRSKIIFVTVYGPVSVSLKKD